MCILSNGIFVSCNDAGVRQTPFIVLSPVCVLSDRKKLLTVENILSNMQKQNPEYSNQYQWHLPRKLDAFQSYTDCISSAALFALLARSEHRQRTVAPSLPSGSMLDSTPENGSPLPPPSTWSVWWVSNHNHNAISIVGGIERVLNSIVRMAMLRLICWKVIKMNTLTFHPHIIDSLVYWGDKTTHVRVAV